MPRMQTPRRRPAATTVEAALILPLTFFLLLALVIGAMGVFRYQEVAFLAREGARYASTHGAQWRKDTGQPAGTDVEWTEDIKTNGILARRLTLEPSRMTVTVTWPPVVNQPTRPDNWPGSKVTVKVQYTWIPEVSILPPVTLTSTSDLPITN